MLVDGVDDGLAPGADVVDAVVEVEDPVERLLRRGDVVALGAEDHDRRADRAQVDGGAVGRADVAGGEVVADEELVDDPLHLLGVQRDVAAPPLLEVEVALGLGVDLGPEVVLLGPEGVGRVLRLEVLHQRRAVEDAGAEVAGERGHPRAAHQPAGVAHRVLAADARPVGERRAGDDDRAEELGAERGEDHHRPAGLAVADDAGLALGLRVAGDHRLEEHRLGGGDVEDGLAGHRLGQEADEVGRVAGLHRDADLAVGLEAADAGAVAGARVDDDEGALPRVDRDALGRDDAGEQVVDRLRQACGRRGRARPGSRGRSARPRRRGPRTGRRGGASRRGRGRNAARRRSSSRRRRPGSGARAGRGVRAMVSPPTAGPRPVAAPVPRERGPRQGIPGVRYGILRYPSGATGV